MDIAYGGTYQRRNEADTLILYYRQYGPDTLFLGRNGEVADTVILADRRPAGRRPFRISGGAPSRVFGAGGVRLTFDRPIETLDTSLIRLLRDTLPDPVPFSYTLDSLDAGVLTLRSAFATGSRYNLSLLPGAVADWVGDVNADTLRQRFAVGDPERYGTLTLNLTNLDPTANYILRLTKGDQVLVATTRYIEKRFEYVAQYPGLDPSTYRVELLYDSNENRRYDSGDIFFGLQPEVVRRFNVEPLRANWEVEQTIDLDAE